MPETLDGQAPRPSAFITERTSAVLASSGQASEALAEADECISLMASLYGWPLVTPIAQVIKHAAETVEQLAGWARGCAMSADSMEDEMDRTARADEKTVADLVAERQDLRCYADALESQLRSRLGATLAGRAIRDARKAVLDQS